MAHDTDHPPRQVEHRPAGIPLIDRRRGLEKLGERHRPVYRVRRVPRADPADAQRTAEPVRGADDEDLVADADGVGVAEWRRDEGTRRRLHAKQREVRGGLGGDDVRRHRGPAHELDRDLVHRLHDVGGRHHVAVHGDDDARADLGDGREPAAVDAHIPSPAADDDDTGAHVGEDAAHVLTACGCGGHDDERGEHGKERSERRAPPARGPAGSRARCHRLAFSSLCDAQTLHAGRQGRRACELAPTAAQIAGAAIPGKRRRGAPIATHARSARTS